MKKNPEKRKKAFIRITAIVLVVLMLLSVTLSIVISSI